MPNRDRPSVQTSRKRRKLTVPESGKCAWFKAGVTVIEILIAFTIFVLVLSTLYTFYVQSRHSERQLTSGFAAQQDLMLAMQHITREVQEGISIFYPAPDPAKPPHTGLGFVSVKGRAVMYYLDTPAAPPGPSSTSTPSIVRVDLVSNERKTIARNVNYFKIKVEPPAEGKKVCLVTINLSILRGTTNVAGKADDYNMVTKVFLRNIKMDLPTPD